jgi:Fe2+ or Zn2+ uptake regulation protein
MLYRLAGKRIPVIPRDTIYRNLKVFAMHGLISTVEMRHERLRIDANMKPHLEVKGGCAKCRSLSENSRQKKQPPETGAGAEAQLC